METKSIAAKMCQSRPGEECKYQTDGDFKRCDLLKVRDNAVFCPVCGLWQRLDSHCGCPEDVMAYHLVSSSHGRWSGEYNCMVCGHDITSADATLNHVLEQEDDPHHMFVFMMNDIGLL